MLTIQQQKQPVLWKKRVLISLVILLIIGALFLAGYLKKVNAYRSQVENLQFSSIDITSIPDGIYVGQCDVDLIAVEVEVTVHNGSIASMELLRHKNGRGAPAEQIMGYMLDRQTTDVDSVSGATNSSRVIRKAVENALLGE